ncbi:MAG: carboxylesterase family protein, partial [Deltaproteobacteria bacterium]|nr:carboxylesterase family protein [Deltaproteobacteria bacterium]
MSDQRANHSSTRYADSTRRSLAAGRAILALAAITGCATAPITEPIAEAGGEILVGMHVDAGDQMMVFRGVPYAAPPAGELRWRPPEPHVPRTGRQDASRFGSACPQLQGNPDWYRDVAEKFGRPGTEIADLTDIREDCLYLNVWTQNLAGDEPQPVMVWIHGGANVNGVAHEPNYLGYNLAKRDVVIVSINYRLGALGFLAHPALSAESERGVSGNYGLLDQIAALEWVRDNIASFGGDPDQVTVFGESAGAADIGTLIASPLSKGLFRRAIIQSGGYSIDYRKTVRDAEAVGEGFLRTLGVDDGPGQLKQMRALSWQDIVDAVPTAAPGGLRDAVID